MSTEPQLFRVDPNTKVSVKATEVDFSHLGLEERRDIQEWVVANPGILGDDLLIIAKEFSDFDRTSERLDLLAIDRDGKLVIIELKRDRSGADAHWQAIKYASYLRHATHEDILRMLATYEDVSEAEAEGRLLEHIETGSLENLNDDQRIILASHRFAPEVTSAVLWLNDKAQDENLITCVQLIPYQDGDVLYVQTNTIIPVVGTERYSIQIGGNGDDGTDNERSNSAGIKAARTRRRNQDDEVTHFVRRTVGKALLGLPDHLKTDSNSRYARNNGQTRWYAIWYSDRFPWERNKFCYVLRVIKRTSDGSLRVIVNLQIRKSYLRNTLRYTDDKISELERFLDNFQEYEIEVSNLFLRPQQVVAEDVTELDDALAEQTATSLSRMIETITTAVEGFVQSHNPDLSA